MEYKDKLIKEYIKALAANEDTRRIMKQYRQAGGNMVELYAAIVATTAAKLSI